ncbi:hypothetical protein T03_5068 [Trichinella britovi]|uniref:Uncharacterized protein n=1 Tax=Trichinella britovi TaxID=45882 RepID=A0A0V1CRU6_TRIBR|nr:hypothetical protein T03_5068 [Trichinella britovi]
MLPLYEVTIFFLSRISKRRFRSAVDIAAFIAIIQYHSISHPQNHVLHFGCGIIYNQKIFNEAENVQGKMIFTQTVFFSNGNFSPRTASSERC